MNTAKDAAVEARALQDVETHHADMLKQLNGLVGLLVEALEAGDSPAGERAQAALLDWCDSDLVPHALAEEGLLYEGPRALPEGKLLVEGMLAEHRVIVELVDELRTATGVQAAIAGSLIQLDKENRLLLPFIAESPGLSLAGSVEGLHELTGESAVRHGHGHAHDAGHH
jgi:hypothetical protein